MQLTKRGVLFVGAPSRAIVIESRFAADPWCYADVMDAPQVHHKVTSRSYDIHG
jgi:hypothetical protein